MANLNKTQQNRVASSLSVIIDNKCMLMKQKLGNKVRLTTEEIIEKVLANEKRFMQYVLVRIESPSNPNSKYINYDINVQNFPPVLKANTRLREQDVKNQNTLAVYKSLLEDERREVMDRLILAAEPDALKAIEDFKKFEILDVIKIT